MANNQIGHFLVFSRNRFFKQVFVVCQLLNSNSPVLARWLDLAALFALLTSLLMQSTSRTCNPAIQIYDNRTAFYGPPDSKHCLSLSLTQWLTFVFLGLIYVTLADEDGYSMQWAIFVKLRWWLMCGQDFEAEVWLRFWGSKISGISLLPWSQNWVAHCQRVGWVLLWAA